MTAPDVVIIGAGVIGASCAYHAARAGLRVVVVDRGPPLAGDGSTARATGGFRAQHATAIDVQLALRSRERLRAFADETGVDPGFVPVGYLWLATDAAQLAALGAAHAVQRACGLTEARLVGRGEAAAANPYAAVADVLGGAWCPSDGIIRPTEVQRGYLTAAARLGAELRFAEPVTAIERAGDRVVAVTTAGGRYPAGRVVLATGAWSRPVGQLAGVEVPVVPVRRQVALTAPTRALPATMPLTIWLADGFHLRVRDDRVLLLRPDAPDPGADPYATDVDPAWLDAIAALAPSRVPALAGVPLERERAWAGLYEMSPDHHALLGDAPGCAGLILATGCSGHGVMHAPALGDLVAELLVRGAVTSLPIAALAPGRFAAGAVAPGRSLL